MTVVKEKMLTVQRSAQESGHNDCCRSAGSDDDDHLEHQDEEHYSSV